VHCLVHFLLFLYPALGNLRRLKKSCSGVVAQRLAVCSVGQVAIPGRRRGPGAEPPGAGQPVRGSHRQRGRQDQGHEVVHNLFFNLSRPG
jgi:hypothetical protein